MNLSASMPLVAKAFNQNHVDDFRPLILSSLRECMLEPPSFLQEYVKTSSRQLEAIKGRQKDYVDGSEEGKELREMKS